MSSANEVLHGQNGTKSSRKIGEDSVGGGKMTEQQMEASLAAASAEGVGVASTSIHVRRPKGGGHSYFDGAERQSSSRELLQSRAMDIAQEQLTDEFQNSHIPDLSDDFPTFADDEIMKGLTLGQGGFGIVYEIRGFNISSRSAYDKNSNSVDSNNKDKEPRYKQQDEVEVELRQRQDSIQEAIRGAIPAEGRGEDNDSTKRTSNTTDFFSIIEEVGMESSFSSDNSRNDVDPHLDDEPEQGQLNGTSTSAAAAAVAKLELEGKINDMHDYDEEALNSKELALRDKELLLAQLRKFIARHCFRGGPNGGGDARYAMKRLKKSVLADPDKLLQGSADMVTETRFLSSLPPHPNIIKLRAISNGEKFSPDYFIVLDRLYSTLEKRLGQWKEDKQRLNRKARKWAFQRIVRFPKKPSPISRRRAKSDTTLTTKGSTSNHSSRTSSNSNTQKPKLSNYQRIQKKKAKLFRDRMMVAFDLSSALAHLHKHHIIHRDLKPDNLGFDVRGDIRIFDFGFAKEIPPCPDDDNGTDNEDDGKISNPKSIAGKKKKTKEVYHFTQMCGTPRYMAPEVALGNPYNESCDVYSFAILFWQLLSLEQPYLGKKCTMQYLYNEVWASPVGNSKDKDKNNSSDGGNVNDASNDTSSGDISSSCARPPVKDKWPIAVQRILQRAWHYDLQSRPAMSDIETELHRQVLSCHNVSQGIGSHGSYNNLSTSMHEELRGGGGGGGGNISMMSGTLDGPTPLNSKFNNNDNYDGENTSDIDNNNNDNGSIYSDAYDDSFTSLNNDWSNRKFSHTRRRSTFVFGREGSTRNRWSSAEF